MIQLQVLLPGPWWHPLSDAAERPVPAGARAVVPIGRSLRVGVSLGVSQRTENIALRKIVRVLDESPVLGDGCLHAAEIISRAFLCSQSEVLRSLLPSAFWKDEKFPSCAEIPGETARTDFFYRYDDAERLDFYREAITSRNGGALCLFPEREQAMSFYAGLVGVVPKDQLILWPASGSQAALKSWKRALEADAPVVIGGPGAAAAPLSRPRLFIVEDESSPAWRSKNFPPFSLRSFAAARARHSAARLILGGRLPSSRVFKNFSPAEQKVPPRVKNSLRIIDLAKVPALSFRGLQCPFPLSDALTAETLRRTAAGETVFWLLDRRGVTAELRCADCGRAILCESCGAPLSYENGKMRCPECGRAAPVPDRCPVCGGMMLQGVSPGLESLSPVARSLLGEKPVFLWHLDNPSTVTEGRRRISALRKTGGLILGSRRALSLLDSLRPGLVCWLDAGAEARQPDYAARFNAFSMLLESCCRGGAERTVMIQTRRPGQPCLKALQNGWGYFWKKELPERAALDFPPTASLVEIELPPGWGDADDFTQTLDEAGFMVMRPDPAGRRLTVLAPKIAPLRRALEKYFSIKLSRKGFPKIQVRAD